MVATFDFMGERSSFPDFPQGNLIAQRGASHIHIATNQAGWYQSREFLPLVERLSSIRARYEKAVLFGGSMGGYGALLFSGALNATRVVALAPQFSPDPSKPPHETRWLEQIKGIDFTNDDLASMASPTAAKYVFYDLVAGPDREHVDLIAGLPNVTLVAMPFSSHYPLTVLHEGGVLREACDALFFSDKPDIELRRLRRLCRRRSSIYLGGLARRLAYRGHIKEALATASKAYALGDASPTAMGTFLGVLQVEPDQFDGLIHMIVRLLQNEQPAWTHLDYLRDSAWSNLKRRAEEYAGL